METSTRQKAPPFRFTRPALGRNGSTGKLHEYVERALARLEKSLDKGFPGPHQGLAEQASRAFEEVQAARQAADAAHREAARLEREAKEAWDSHRAAEDAADRLAQTAAEARQERERHRQGPDPLPALEKRLEEARRTAADLKKKAEAARVRATPDKASQVPPADLAKAKQEAKEAQAAWEAAEEEVKRCQQALEAELAAERSRDPERLKSLEADRDEARNAAADLKLAAERLARDRDAAQEAAAGDEDAARAEEEAAADLQRNLEDEGRACIEALGRPLFSNAGGGGTLVGYLEADYGDDRARKPLIDLIHDRRKLADLDEVKAHIERNLNTFGFNERALLSRGRVVELLFARAIYRGGLESSGSIYNALLTGKDGWKSVHGDAARFALETLRDERKISIDDGTLRVMGDRLTKAEEPISLQRDALEAVMTSLVNELVHGAEERAVLDAAKRAGVDVPERYVPELIGFIRRSNQRGEKIDAGNAAYFVSIALARLRKQDVTLSPGVGDGEVGVEDYRVEYYEERAGALEYDSASIEAAAQMFLTMVWGDELGIFEVVDRIAAQSPQLRLEIRSRSLAEDLRTYVLDEHFGDLKTGRTSRRIAPAERQMFYRQVFGVGDGSGADGAYANSDFPRLWGVLMTEVVRYIGKVEENSDGFSSISANKVYQAIEELQYNLSSACSGLAKVAAPTMHGELDFVIQRILDSEDVKSQLARRGGKSFWRVVEHVRGVRGFTTLRSKGMYGHSILSKIATATPALVEDQRAFEEFVSTVEAYILSEEQLSADGALWQPGGGGASAGYGGDADDSLRQAEGREALPVTNGEWNF